MNGDFLIHNQAARAPQRDLDAFDPAYGYDLQTLLEITTPPAPDDFAAFWQGRWNEAEALSSAMQLEQREPRRVGDRLISEVYYTSRGGLRIGAWISAPAEGPILRGMLVGHGYGGREAPDPVPLEHTVAIFPCARGFHLSRNAAVPDTAMQHVLVGIEDRDHYILGDCVCDYWLGLSALLELYPEAQRDVVYTGVSFGGGIGAFVVAGDPRIHRAVLVVPSFGGHHLRLQMPCQGSGEAVRNYYMEHPEVVDVLRYYDAAYAAGRIRVPVLGGLALYDPSVPPPGQFAVFNALGGPRELFVFSCGHHACALSEKDDALFKQLCHAFIANGKLA